MSARTRRRTKQAPRPAATTAAGPARKLVDFRRPLPKRPVQKPHTVCALREARAAQVAAWFGFRVPVLAWSTTHAGTAYARLADGTILAHTGGAAPFTAYVPCLLGAHHQHPVRNPATLYAARAATDDCTTLHGDFTDWPDMVDLPRATAAVAARRDAEHTLSLVLPLHERAKEHPDV